MSSLRKSKEHSWGLSGIVMLSGVETFNTDQTGRAVSLGGSPCLPAGREMGYDDRDAKAIAAASTPLSLTNAYLKRVLSGANILLLITLLLLTTGCEDPVYTPKPKGYFRLDLPEKEYQEFTVPQCPYRFSIPTYATVAIDSSFFNERPDDPCWLDINMPELAGEIHLSYKEIGEDNTLEKLIEDAHKLAYKHTIKADYIDEAVIEKPGDQVSGILYQIGGNAASNIQFYVTDSTRHFLRGSLYFGVTPNEDSLAPVISFVRQDLLYMIETLEWEER